MNFVNNPLSMGSAIHAAKRAADIIFVLQNKDRLNSKELVDRIHQVLESYGEKSPKVTYADLDDLKITSGKLYSVFIAKTAAEAVRQLNAILAEYAHAPRLSNHGNSSWHMHIDSNDHAPWAEWFAASSALALAILLAEKQRNPGGLCASPTCKRPFIDLGKGGGRNYCSPKCATRERVAAYRKKERA
ncbi:MAG TPA: CGNR zinc finger domain-containing protein [Candidatus Saccharimonadales bacterium]|nr:CGNR zinc finger domain-containing protein [Candidatus Saccharimonadales bacterium]